MKFFRLSLDRPTSGLITIRPGDQIRMVNASPDISLAVEFSTTDGQKETMPLLDEINLENTASYLRRAYFRMEIIIAEPKKLKYSDEAHCKLEIY